MKTNQSFRESKLHLGCGERYIPGFIHVDLNQSSHIDYCCNIYDLSFIGDNEVSLIYASHSLEYFDRTDVVAVLHEWRRVLRVGGILRLAVPDFEGIVKVYRKYGDIEHIGILGPLYGKWTRNEDDTSMYHKTAYDFTSLKGVLEGSGFESIRRFDWRDTDHSDCDDYSQAYVPHMDKENGILISLNVEAIKAKNQ